MECLTSKETINNIVEKISDVSYIEKKQALTTEAEINQFLDNLLELYKILNKKTATVENINELLENISWLEDVNEDCLKLLNVLISLGRDFHSTLIRQHANLLIVSKNGVAINEIEEFKESIDDLIELIDDLESAFFSLPKIPGFIETTQQLSSL